MYVNSCIILICVCVDVDECALGTDNCHDNATCNNTDGSFECSCNDGYSGNGTSCESKRTVKAILMREDRLLNWDGGLPIGSQI
jgi:hypothetical protein